MDKAGNQIRKGGECVKSITVEGKKEEKWEWTRKKKMVEKEKK